MDHSRTHDEPLVSTGRGGLGNFVSKDSQHVQPVDEPRGRQASPLASDRITHTGRGGAGNIRSPSRDPEARKADEAEALREEKIIREHQHHDDGPHSTGRGGLGNINVSRSRSPATRTPLLHSTGRGGLGNMHPDVPLTDADKKIMEEDAQVLAKHHHEGATALHSTGRGGEGNMTTSVPPPPDSSESAVLSAAHDREATEPHSSGRGGLGNILHSTPHEPEDEERGRTHQKGVVGKIIDTFGGKSRERASRERAGNDAA